MSLLPKHITVTCFCYYASVINAFSQEGNISPLYNPNLEGHLVFYPSPTGDGCQPWLMGGHLPEFKISVSPLWWASHPGYRYKSHLPEESWFGASNLPLHLQNLPKQSYNGHFHLFLSIVIYSRTKICIEKNFLCSHIAQLVEVGRGHLNIK